MCPSQSHTGSTKEGFKVLWRSLFMPKLESQTICIAKGESWYPQECNSEHPSEMALGRVANAPYPYILILPWGHLVTKLIWTLKVQSQPSFLSGHGSNESPFGEGLAIHSSPGHCLVCSDDVLWSWCCGESASLLHLPLQS